MSGRDAWQPWELHEDFARGRIRHALFDFDGTLSTLRQGWEGIMGPVCVEMIAGDGGATPEIVEAVQRMIDETTGIQTIYQMQRLREMVRAFGRVPEERIRTAEEYKAMYLERLHVPVRARLAQIERGEKTRDDFRIRGCVDFLEGLRTRGVTCYVFSGTDREDVRHECGELKLDHYFAEIWGAIPNLEAYSKEKVIRDIIAAHDLAGPEVIAIGDGPVELRAAREVGGIALGVASDEERGHGWNPRKRERLLRAGAHLLVPDFSEAPKLLAYLFNEA
jgi:phosphoglycolate phosphatase-like HAD superfamily hydrolase